jgi:hypothetical protein
MVHGYKIEIIPCLNLLFQIFIKSPLISFNLIKFNVHKALIITKNGNFIVLFLYLISTDDDPFNII